MTSSALPRSAPPCCRAARQELADVTGLPVPAGESTKAAAFGKGIVVLRNVHRHGEAIAALARAIRQDDADEAMGILRAGDSNVQWIATDAVASAPSEDLLGDVRRLAVDTGRAVIGSAGAGDARAAIDALGQLPSPVRPPARSGGRGDVDGPHRELAPFRRGGFHHGRRLVRRAARSS